MSSFSSVFLYQCPLCSAICAYFDPNPTIYTMKFHVLIKFIPIDGSFACIQRNVCQQILSAPWMASVDKRRKKALKWWWMKYPPGCFLYTIPIPGYGYIIYICLCFLIEDNQTDNLFLWYLLNLDPLHPLHQWSQSTAKPRFSRFRRCLGDGNKAFCGRPQIFTSPGRYLDSAPLTANAHCVACPEKVSQEVDHVYSSTYHIYQVVFSIGIYISEATNNGTKSQERSPVRKVWRICWTLNLTRWYTLHLETWHLPEMCSAENWVFF